MCDASLRMPGTRLDHDLDVAYFGAPQRAVSIRSGQMIGDVACDVAPQAGGERFAGARHRSAEADLELRGWKTQLRLNLVTLDVEKDRAVRQWMAECIWRGEQHRRNQQHRRPWSHGLHAQCRTARRRCAPSSFRIASMVEAGLPRAAPPPALLSVKTTVSSPSASASSRIGT